MTATLERYETVEIEPHTDEWYAWRNGGVTASMVAQAATGIYGTMFTVVDDILNPTDFDDPTDAQRRGTDAEDFIADAVGILIGGSVTDRQQCVQRVDRPTDRATLDGRFRNSNGIILGGYEGKTSGRFVSPPWAYYEAQVQWQMWITGDPFVICALGQFAPHMNAEGNEVDTLVGVDWKRIDADPDYQQILVELADKIISHVRAGTLPIPDGAEPTTQRVKLRTAFGERNEDPTFLDIADELLDERNELVDERRGITERVHEIDNALKLGLGSNTYGVTERYAVKLPVKRKLDVAALAADFPEIVERCAAPGVDIPRLEKLLSKAVVDDYRKPDSRGSLSITSTERHFT